MKAVMDPGFLRRKGGGAPTSKVGRQPIIWPNIFQKLHENERIRTQGARPWRPPGFANGKYVLL